MFQLSFIFMQPLSGKALRFKTVNSDSNARLDIQAIAVNGFGMEGLSVLFLMSTLVHHQITLLSLLIAAMRRTRGVSMNNVYAKLSMAISHH